MTYSEYLNWLDTENIELKNLRIRINNNLFMDFEAGCYDNQDGTWTFYECEERGEICKKIGTEQEIFEKLKKATESKIVEREYMQRRYMIKKLKEIIKGKSKSIKEIESLCLFVEKHVRFKEGKGFAVMKVEKGQEIRKSEFFQNEEKFIQYMLNLLQQKKLV